MSKWFSRSTVTLAALALLFAVAFGIRLRGTQSRW